MTKTHVLLYAEDEESDVFFMRRAFSQRDPSIALHTVSTGPEAIAYLAGTGAFGDRTRHPVPTVVLLDVNLPGCSGFDVLKWLREQSTFDDLPVVMFSSSLRPEDVQKAHGLRANGYLEKPASGLAFSDIAEELRQSWMNGRPPSSPHRTPGSHP